MPILFRCEHCGQRLSISTRKAGTKVPCPNCEKLALVPLPEAKIVTDEPERVAEPRRAPLPPTREVPKPSAPPLAETLPQQRAAPPSAPMEPPPKPALLFPPPASLPPEAESDDEEGFTLRSRSTEQEDMDLTPMVDVTFLLLIFFMITASFSLTKTIETPPPDPENKGAQQTIQNMEELELSSIMVRIDDQDGILVDDEPVSNPKLLEELFADKLRAEQKNELVIQASSKSRHETFVSVFDAATGAGMQKIRLATVGSDE